MKLVVLPVLLALSCGLALGQLPPGKSLGQNLYLPVYSHIWHGETDKHGQPMKTLVSVSVSVRNTDPLKPIRITSAQYYDTDGKKLREYAHEGYIDALYKYVQESVAAPEAENQHAG